MEKSFISKSGRSFLSPALRTTVGVLGGSRIYCVERRSDESYFLAAYDGTSLDIQMERHLLGMGELPRLFLIDVRNNRAFFESGSREHGWQLHSVDLFTGADTVEPHRFPTVGMDGKRSWFRPRYAPRCFRPAWGGVVPSQSLLATHGNWYNAPNGGTNTVVLQLPDLVPTTDPECAAGDRYDVRNGVTESRDDYISRSAVVDPFRGRLITGAQGGGLLRSWDIKTMAVCWSTVLPLASTDHCILGLELSRDGSFVVARTEYNQLFSIEADQGRVAWGPMTTSNGVGNISSDSMQGRMAVSPDGAEILVPDRAGQIARLTSDTGMLLGVLTPVSKHSYFGGLHVLESPPSVLLLSCYATRESVVVKL